jgi:hypothetical protein
MFCCIISLYTTDYDFLQVLFLSTNTYTCTVKPVYKRHSREPEHVPFISRLKLCALLIGKIRLPFIDSDLLYRGAL